MRSTRAGLVAIVWILELAAPARSLAGGGRETPAAAPARILVSFKLDPRLAGPTYGGERWVSPPTYAGASAQETVEVRALAVDARGRPLEVDLEWTASDPERVTVSPRRGQRVEVTARRAGASSVTVAARGATRTLRVEVVDAGGIRQLRISQ